MISKRLLLIALSCLTTFSFANTPPACPHVDMLKQERLSNALYFEPTPEQKHYFIYEQSHYNTPNDWLFGITPIKAETKEAALTQANYLLEAVSGTPVAIPVKHQAAHIWLCQYQTEEGYFAQAVSMSKPNITSQPSLSDTLMLLGQL
jgi:hypothetical protein